MNLKSDKEVSVVIEKFNVRPPDKKFKPFNDTYVYCSFGLAFGLIYPNKTNVRQRWVLAVLLLVVNFAELLWFVAYFISCVRISDWFNVLRNMTILLIVTLFFFKSFYVNWKNVIFHNLLKKITADLLKGNELDEDYQDIYDVYVKEAKFGQILWFIIPVMFSAQYPLNAAAATIYERMKSDDGKRYMQHEMDLLFLKDVQYDTPYYEIVFAYNFLQAFILIPTFTGFDGSFCISTTHLRMKLHLMTHKLNKAIKDIDNVVELRLKVKEVIRDHQDALEFHSLMQEVYGGWLFMVFMLSSSLLSFNLYQMYLIKKFNVRNIIFMFSAIVHIFAPCHYAHNLLRASENLGTDIYNVPWEKRADNVTTKLLIIMIAKAQDPLILTGKGIVTFNMQVFISIAQTAYSFFTLITS